MSLHHPVAPPRSRSRVSSGHGSASRTMSANVLRLHESLTNLLNGQDKAHFVHALNDYNSKRNVYTLVHNLMGILNTPEKKQLYVLLGKVIPSSDQTLFWQHVDALCMGASVERPQSVVSNVSPNNVSSMNGSMSRPESRLYQQNTRTIGRPSSSLQSLNHPSNVKQNSETSFQHQNQSYREQNHLQQPHHHHQHLQPGGDELHGKVARKTTDVQLPVEQNRDLKRIVLRKSDQDGGGLGFSIRGGAEHSVGIFVSLVEANSLAEKRGLIKGDQIMQVNDIPFEKVAHSDAVKILKAVNKLVLYVKSVGRVPGSFFSHQTYTWVNPKGRSVSPPPDVDPLGGRMLNDTQNRKSGLNLLKNGDEKKVNVVVNEGESLGLMIRGGKEFGLGIYITGIDTYSVADHAGLKVGDQILDVNSRNFLDIEHQNAVDILKSSKLMMMTIKDVGKLPYGRTTIDRTQWLTGNEVKDSPPTTRPVKRDQVEETDSIYADIPERPSSAFSRGIGSQVMYNKSMAGVQNWSMLEDQSRNLLSENERGTMMYYLEEYQRNTITVEALVMALFELFDTHAKFSLLSEIRAFIFPRDIDRFDGLVLKREVEAMKARQRGYFMNERETSFTDTMSNSSRYNSSSSIDSRPLTPPRIPQHLPPNIRLTNEPEERYRGLDTRQINDDTNGLPDFALPDYAIGSPSSNNNTITPNKNKSLNRSSPSILKSSSLFNPTNGFDSPNLKHVTVDVHHHNHVNQEPSTSGRGVILPGLESMYIGTKSPSEDSGVDVNLTNGLHSLVNLERYKMSDSNDRYHNMTSDTDFSPRSSEESPRSPDSSLEPSPSRVQEEKREASSSQTKDDASDRHSERSGSRQRRMSLDSVSTEGSASVIGELISRQNSGSEHGIPRRISDPTHHTPKDQRRNIDQTKKASETLYELRKSTPTSPHSPTTTSKTTSNQRLSSSSSSSSSQRGAGNGGGRTRPILPPPPPPSAKENSNQSSNPSQSLPYQSVEDLPLPPPPLDFLSAAPFDLPPPLPSPPVNRFPDDAPPLPPTTPPPPPPGFETEDEDEDEVVLPNPSSFPLVATSRAPMSTMSTFKPQGSSTPDKPTPDIIVNTRLDRPPYCEAILVKKTQSNLGLAVEGGSGTRQPLPKIIKVQNGGSAYQSSNLKVGHVILKVNGRPLHDLSHSQSTRVIAEAFKQKSSNTMEFLVLDSNRFKLVY
ncbi:whirlin isoform X1 [Strongylocentrotus purpuratus]|uniref:Whirlin n=1 Tax=Strongylocentrotus purpuratus TaxID=7668 RepID=A0A7M7RE59_STRPU|nr:whirlin isoform X1 [Strongylocentrotus purpuratus]